MTKPPVIAIGGSAGAIEALRELLPLLSADSENAYAIVIHRGTVDEDERLPRVIGRYSALPVHRARDGETIRAGVVSVCPANVHLLVRDGTYVLNSGAKENGVRPCIDVLFRSVAEECGHRGAGVVLSGLLDDGTVGLALIRAHGGYAIAQSPEEARYTDMPRNAIAGGGIDVMRIAAMPEAFRRFASGDFDHPAIKAAAAAPSLTAYSCPDCGGVLSKYDGHSLLRCRVGHAYTEQILENRQEQRVEAALWSAIRALEEQADLVSRIAEKMKTDNLGSTAWRLQHRAKRARDRAAIVRKALPSIAEAAEQAEALK